ncbi:MAG TPA: hypothetical protein VGK73_36615 [Polyangiaceae bacterium]
MVRLLALGAVAAVFASAAPAFATPQGAPAPAVAAAPTGAPAPEIGRAEAMFQQGRALLAEGRYGEACRSFSDSQALDPASGTLLALAYCQELSGLLASAWTNYRSAAELAQREGQVERRDAAAGQFEGLAERLSFLTVVVPKSLAKEPGLKVTRDGVELPPGQFGTAVPVDGGNYRIEATLPQGDTWSATVSVRAERDKKILVVELVPANESSSQTVRIAPTTANRPSDAGPAPQRKNRTLEYASLGTGIASVVSLGIGIGFGVAASSKNSASENHCDAQSVCDAEGFELRNDALHAATISTWSFAVGGVLAATSVALYIGSLSQDGRSATRVDITARPDLAAIRISEAF